MENENKVPETNKEETTVVAPKPTREQMRNFHKRMQHENSKYMRVKNEIKMKKAAQARKKLSRKPSNFTKGA